MIQTSQNKIILGEENQNEKESFLCTSVYSNGSIFNRLRPAAHLLQQQILLLMQQLKRPPKQQMIPQKQILLMQILLMQQHLREEKSSVIPVWTEPTRSS